MLPDNSFITVGENLVPLSLQSGAGERLLPPPKPTFQDRLYWDSRCHQQKRLTFVNKGELTERVFVDLVHPRPAASPG